MVCKTVEITFTSDVLVVAPLSRNSMVQLVEIYRRLGRISRLNDMRNVGSLIGRYTLMEYTAVNPIIQ